MINELLYELSITSSVNMERLKDGNVELYKLPVRNQIYFFLFLYKIKGKNWLKSRDKS